MARHTRFGSKMIKVICWVVGAPQRRKQQLWYKLHVRRVFTREGTNTCLCLRSTAHIGHSYKMYAHCQAYLKAYFTISQISRCTRLLKLMVLLRFLSGKKLLCMGARFIAKLRIMASQSKHNSFYNSQLRVSA